MGAINPLRVFVVEDEALLAMELSDMLRDLGHEVIGPVPSVDRAIALLDRLTLYPNVAVVDANLGGEMSTRVVDRLKTAGVPTILASGYDPAELTSMGLTGTHLRKPYTKKRLSDILKLFS